MGHRGNFGVSMGTIIRKKRAIDPNSKHCTNCKHYFKGKCRKINEISNGQQVYIADKTSARKCVYFANKHVENRNTPPKMRKDSHAQKKVKNKTNISKNKDSSLIVEKIQQSVQVIIDNEVTKIHKAREKCVRYVSPITFECETNTRIILSIRGNEQVEYNITTGHDSGNTRICSLSKFIEEALGWH